MPPGALACSAPSVFVEAPYVVARVPDAGEKAPVDAGEAGALLVDGPPRLPFRAGETWSGTYVCAQGSTDMQLHVRDVQGAEVVVVFAFNHAATGVSGEFEMSGTYVRSTRRLRLVAGKWLSRPNGYVTVDLEGRLTPDGRSLSGHIQGPGCTIFEVHHEG